VVTLRIEHPVPDLDAWRRAFDADPLDRRGSGVRRYRILRSLDDPSHVLVDLDFDSREEAEAMRGALRELWSRVQREGVIGEGRTSIAEILENTDL
jgi:hypothetical protein